MGRIMKIFKSFIKWITYGFIEQPVPTQYELEQVLEEERKFWNAYFEKKKQESEALPEEDNFPGFLITVDGGLKPVKAQDSNYLYAMRECIFNAFKLPSGLITPDMDMVVGGKSKDVLYLMNKTQCVTKL